MGTTIQPPRNPLTTHKIFNKQCQSSSADSEASLLGFRPPNCDIDLKREEGTLEKGHNSARRIQLVREFREGFLEEVTARISGVVWVEWCTGCAGQNGQPGQVRDSLAWWSVRVEKG